jgi:hypothetical protein
MIIFFEGFFCGKVLYTFVIFYYDKNALVKRKKERSKMQKKLKIVSLKGISIGVAVAEFNGMAIPENETDIELLGLKKWTVCEILSEDMSVIVTDESDERSAVVHTTQDLLPVRNISGVALSKDSNMPSIACIENSKVWVGSRVSVIEVGKQAVKAVPDQNGEFVIVGLKMLKNTRSWVFIRSIHEVDSLLCDS